jgi:hypothetical protein
VAFSSLDAFKQVNEHTRDELRTLSGLVTDLTKQVLALGARVAALEDKH